MPHKLNEAAIESHALDLLARQGYTVLHGPDIAPEGASPERASYSQIYLPDRIRTAARRINTHLPRALASSLIDQAMNEFSRVHTGELLADNETLHRMLTEGVTVSYQDGGAERGALVWLIDFARPDNNEFLAVNQFTVEEKGNNKRPDVVLFANGIITIRAIKKLAAYYQYYAVNAAVVSTLRLYGYPPGMQMLGTETVLKQAEMVAGNFV